MADQEGIRVEILDYDQALTDRNFGTVVTISGQNDADWAPGFVNQEIRYYKTRNEVNTDPDLGSGGRGALLQSFDQRPRVSEVALARVFSLQGQFMDSQLNALLANAQAVEKDFYAVDLYSEPFSGGPLEATLVDATADWCERNRRLYACQSDASGSIGGAGNDIAGILQSGGYTRAFFIYHAISTQCVTLMLSSKKLAADPDVQTTSWSRTELKGASPQLQLTAAEQATLLGKNGNFYSTLQRKPSFGPGVLSDGSPVDTLISKDWAEARVSRDVARLFVDTYSRNDQIPFTDTGISMVSSVIQKVLTDGERIGHFRPKTTSLTVPRLSEVSAQDIADRTISFSGKAILAGMIESVNVEVSVLFTE